MAKQVGIIKFTGTFGGVTFYRMNGAYYARAKSSLSSKKVKTHPNFAQTRKYAQWLGEASKMASAVYKTLPPEQRKYEMYCELKKIAYALVKKETNREQVVEELRRKAEGKQGKAERRRLRARGKRRKAKGERLSPFLQVIPHAFNPLPSPSHYHPIVIPSCTSAPPRLRGSPFIPAISCLILAR